MSANESSNLGGNPLGNSEKIVFQIPRNIGQNSMTGEKYLKYIDMIKDEQSKI
jgi:hypothetical protein